MHRLARSATLHGIAAILTMLALSCPVRSASASPPQVIISEFMAANDSMLSDADGDFSDWIEILNTSDEIVNLDGWFLTDDAENLERWGFPAMLLRPRESRLVFASNKNRTDAAGELHTNFRLASPSAYLALVRPDGETIEHEFAPAYPEQIEDISYGLEFETTTLIKVGAKVDVHIPKDDALGRGWTAADFTTDTADWFTSTTGVGFQIADVAVAGELLVDLDAENLREGELVRWRSAATLGDFVTPGGRPVVETVAGVRAVTFDGTRAWMRSEEIVPESITNTEDWTVEVWAYNPVVGFRESMLSWTRLSGPSGAAASLNYGSASDYGAVEHRGAADMSYPGGAPAAGRWHHIALTYTGGPFATERLFVDGEMVQAKSVSLRLHGIADGNPVPVLLGTSTGLSDLTDLAGDFSGSIARVRIHSGALAPGEVVGNYLAHAERFGAPVDPDERRASRLTGADVESRMLGLSPSAYARIGFDLAPGFACDLLTLRMRYDDGFVAYLNGAQVAERNAPPAPVWDSTATTPSRATAACDGERIDISAHRDLLQTGPNVLAIHGMNADAADPDFRILPELIATKIDTDTWMYQTNPTPGAINARQTLYTGPVIAAVAHAPNLPRAGESLLVTASVRPTSHSLTTVTLAYRVMYEKEFAIEMVRGADNTYSARIPASDMPEAGRMIRYRLSAADAGGFESRAPLFHDRVGEGQSPEYYGTVVADPSILTQLPVFQWFSLQPELADNPDRSGTRASVSYAGEFYDNVFVRLRGGTAAGWPKRHYKFEFNNGFHFQFDPQYPRVNEINLNSAYTDKSYVRHILASETFRDSGTLYSETFPVRLERNGAFFSVAFFIEQIDRDCLRRNGLDERGALYKGNANAGIANGLTGSSAVGFFKRNRKHESFEDLQDFIDGLAQSGDALRAHLFDTVDLPAQITYMAANVVIQNIDRTVKNFYMYRDTEGSGEWQMMPWDLDLTFGPNALNTDFISGQEDDGNRSGHPYMGGSAYPFTTLQNRLLDVIFRIPETNQMFVRRLRTLMDEMLTTDTQHYEKRIDELVALIEADVELDHDAWDGSSHFGGLTHTLREATERIKKEYLIPRRVHLFEHHNIDNPRFPGNAGIPNAQPERPALAFGAIEYHPAGDNQDEEYIEIVNRDATPLDLSLWRVEGAVEHALRPGTVIATSHSLFLTPSARAFRARAEGPSGGQGLFVQGDYAGRLSDFGGELRLVAPDGWIATSATYAGDAAPRQEFLRLTELHYHPSAPTPSETEAGIADGEDFEFVELRNTSARQTIDLAGVRFTQGIEFDFTTGAVRQLAPGARALVVKNRRAFAARYGAGFAIAGEYAGNLRNSGESIILIDGTSATIHEFSYDDGNGWPRAADGLGPSLEVIDTEGDYNDPANWRASSETGGTPGYGDGDAKSGALWVLY